MRARCAACAAAWPRTNCIVVGARAARRRELAEVWCKMMITRASCVVIICVHRAEGVVWGGVDRLACRGLTPAR